MHLGVFVMGCPFSCFSGLRHLLSQVVSHLVRVTETKMESDRLFCKPSL